MNDERFGVPGHDPQTPDHAPKNPTPPWKESSDDDGLIPPAPPTNVENESGLGGFSSPFNKRVSDGEDAGSGIPVIWDGEPTTNVSSTPTVLTSGSNEGAEFPVIWGDKPDQGNE